MKRNPRVVLGEERSDTSLVSDLLSNVYSTVMPHSLRGLTAGEIITEERKVAEIACADMEEHASRVALGYSTAGFTIWQFVSANKATEILTETECGPVRLIRFLPPVKGELSTVSNDRKNDAAKTDDESSIWDEIAKGNGINNGNYGFDSNTADLMFVEAKQDHIMKLCNIRSSRIVEEVSLPAVIDDFKVSPRMVGVMLKNHAAHIFLRSSKANLASSKSFVVPHAHPLVLGMRWVAYGAKSFLESKLDPDGTSSSSSSTSSPILQAQTGWQDITKTLAAGAFRLGEASTKRLSGYLLNPHQQQQQSGITLTPNGSTEETDLSCGCDMIVVRDCVSEKNLCKIADATSHLSFDGSGTLLCSSSSEGQSLYVYALPRGTLLYKFERGLRPAKIISVCFSPDRKWLAVTSARGTTHLFPIHPNGSRPSVQTHVSTFKNGRNLKETLTADTLTQNAVLGWLTSNMLTAASPRQRETRNLTNGNNSINGASPISSPSLNRPRYMMDLQPEVHTTSALAKISSSTSAPVRLVKFLDKSTIRLLSGNGIIEEYRLIPSLVAGNEKEEMERFVLDVKISRAFDLSSNEDETLLPATASATSNIPHQTGIIGSSTKLFTSQSFDISVSNFEIQPSPEPLVPTWSSPQFTMMQTSGGASDGDSNSLFWIPEGTPLELRTAAPPPGLADAIRTPAFGSQDA
jgi:hypothetical protein